MLPDMSILGQESSETAHGAADAERAYEHGKKVFYTDKKLIHIERVPCGATVLFDGSFIIKID